MILITGATGNNGQELVRQLTAMGQRVRAFVRNPAEAAHLKGPNIESAVGDFDQPETLDAALQGVEKAFLLTPVAAEREARIGVQRRAFWAVKNVPEFHLKLFQSAHPNRASRI